MSYGFYDLVGRRSDLLVTKRIYSDHLLNILVKGAISITRSVNYRIEEYLGKKGPLVFRSVCVLVSNTIG